ncbi:hypothetical protein [uncultured Hyphomonas sp.]|uniref:hypothetical protein n=1 Tax=uncultured Hyphomonas sp. TaxID=225298 RepID=UPI002AAAC86C|nr:hypothetical protein [uncultured Hyphomonas sp.]
MIRQFLHSQIRKFGRAFSYDVTYMHEIADVSPAAAYTLSKFPNFYKYRGPEAGRPVWTGALLASTLEGDCGPCAQLVVDMALANGADADALQACAEGRPKEAGAMGLGFRFACAAISGDVSADELHREIENEFGRKAAISCAFAAASGRVYPVLKRGLGHGQACQRLDFGGKVVKLAA